jgi:hypothetical protein
VQGPSSGKGKQGKAVALPLLDSDFYSLHCQRSRADDVLNRESRVS